MVFVDDNYHYMDESYRYKLGEYDSWESAVKAAKSIVDEFLIEGLAKTKSADELLKAYKQYGEDPFIVGADAEKRFSAWEYAASRCRELFGEII